MPPLTRRQQRQLNLILPPLPEDQLLEDQQQNTPSSNQIVNNNNNNNLINMSNNNNSDNNNLKFKAVLEGVNNFDIWWLKLDNYFYSKKWDIFWQRAQQDTAPADEPTPASDDTNARRLAWQTVYSSLSDDELTKFREVPRGAIELLLRKIRLAYVRKNEITIDNIRLKLQHARLINHHDINAYIAHMIV